METYELTAAPILDWNGRYLGTVTEADLRRHVASTDQAAALATPLSTVERRSHNLAVTIDRDVESLVEQASGHRFIPVVDDSGRLLGIVDRRRILDLRLPSAALPPHSRRHIKIASRPRAIVQSAMTCANHSSWF